MQGSEKKTKELRQQASVEAEVARSRLALAAQDIEKGETELAIRRSVEASFDAGVAHGYATEANQKKFGQETKMLLSEAQSLVAIAGDRAGITDAHGRNACEGAYKAGIKYAKARNRNNNSEVQEALALYESSIEEVGVGRMSNPAVLLRRPPRPPMSVGRLKAKLLR